MTTYTTILLKSVDELFEVPDSGKSVLLRPSVVPVEISSLERTPVVTYYHTVWVQHRDNLKYKLIPQLLWVENGMLC